MNPGTNLWAIKQLLDGKKITNQTWKYGYYIHLVGNEINDSSGYYFPLRELALERGWQLWTPPNPYPTGTFPWAWEELWRGNKVSCHEPSYTKTHPITYWFQGDKLMTQEDNYDNYVSTMIPVELIKSTNWKLA